MGQLGEKGLEEAFEWVGSILLALLLLVSPMLLAWLAGGSIEHWVPIYVAGALGGLILELILSRGQIEIPGPARTTSPDDEKTDDRRPLLAQIDLGVCGRMLLGGLAAASVLLLAAGAFAKEGQSTVDALHDAARNDLNIGWALAIGASALAVWKALRSIVDKRMAALTTALFGATTTLDDTISTLTESRDAVADHAEAVASAADRHRRSIQSQWSNVMKVEVDLGPDLGSMVGAPAELSEAIGSLKAIRSQLAVAAKQAGVSG